MNKPIDAKDFFKNLKPSDLKIKEPFTPTQDGDRFKNIEKRIMKDVPKSKYGMPKKSK
jgi:hypothetical protein